VQQVVLFWHTWPATEHAPAAPHEAMVPPQPSGMLVPQVYGPVAHVFGVQPATQLLEAEQLWPAGQVPQVSVWPQPSLTVPQVMPAQLAVVVQHALVPALHTWPAAQQVPLQVVFGQAQVLVPALLQAIPAPQQVVPQACAEGQQPLPSERQTEPAAQLAAQQMLEPAALVPQIPDVQLPPPEQVLPFGLLASASDGASTPIRTATTKRALRVDMRSRAMCNRHASAGVNRCAEFRRRRSARDA